MSFLRRSIVPTSWSHADSYGGGAAGGVQPEESAYDRENGTMERQRNGPETEHRRDVSSRADVLSGADSGHIGLGWAPSLVRWSLMSLLGSPRLAWTSAPGHMALTQLTTAGLCPVLVS
ncbi:unnamed protein product [Boreogadus saida]